ncbi:16S rRNA (cytidine(1402)-2'-O)-methyltransferase [Marinobacter bryozoorum]|uniref:16S rRNA (cytidine(1402)-2'-O)-methyltransferase n=1 Tax=Marinobacter bryozoorum TaxID=256324 RepID=UPI0020053963|nr:16S rRNA (cytidine(1402)-2'-O)-methyltransferase [Marinobacter bryozoorum]MCK7543860.1 16S rRNA (cytidine(1402)-2'-O)-methyltransferase [Marinobacter bryozoorum]
MQTVSTPAPATGTLFIVATPIGNLDDLSRRAEKVLASVDLVAAEDTRHSGRLLQHLGLNKAMWPLHDHNERERSGALLDRIAGGESVALVSDAGTPLISDPGYVLVRAARQRGIRVVPVPGACAMVAALSAAGLPTDRFLFAGFLPVKTVARSKVLESLSREESTLVFYESPRRVVALLEDICNTLGEGREVVLARELTKAFETWYSGSVTDVVDALRADAHSGKGEYVVMVGGSPSAGQARVAVDADRVLSLLVPELPLKKAVKVAAELTGVPRNELYQRALELKDQ